MTDPSGGDKRLRYKNGIEFKEWDTYLDVYNQNWLKKVKFIMFLVNTLVRGVSAIDVE